MDRLPKHLYYSVGAEKVVGTLFVLESPYIEELYWEYPCMGATGKKMSEALIQSAKIALGDLIQRNNPQTRKYALFETFIFPLDEKLTKGLDVDELVWKKIKRRTGKLSIEKFFVRNQDFFPTTYKTNLMAGIQIFPNLKRIVVCGDIARLIFEKIFGKNLMQNKGCAGKCFDVVFVGHPARSARTHSKWTYSSNMHATYKMFF